MSTAVLPTRTADVAPLIRRADAYRLLAAAFCQPCDAWHEEGLFVNLADLLAELHPEVEAAARQLAGAYADADHQALEIEAARLFVGPFRIAVPPYGSCYLDDGRRVMGDSTVAIQALYREWGFELAPDANEMPDHIAVELEFMYIILHKLAKALQTDDGELVSRTVSAANGFVDRHLFPLASLLGAELSEHAQHDVYESLADVLIAFMNAEKKMFSSAAVSG